MIFFLKSNIFVKKINKNIKMNNISEENKTLENFKVWKAIIPVFIGFIVIIYLIFREIDKIDFSVLKFSKLLIIFLIFTFLMMIFRDLGYIIRLRILSSKALSWIKCFRIIMLWEFTSAITPSAVGGTSIATIFLWKEGLTVGNSTSIVIATSFLDELYFSIVFPLIFLIFNLSELFPKNDFYFLSLVINGNSLLIIAIIGYVIKLLWTILMAYSIFKNPAFFGKLVKKIFKFRLLKKWLPSAEKMAIDFEISNKELKQKGLKFWIKTIIATFLSWTSRFLVLNFLLIGFVIITSESTYYTSFYEQIIIFARQLTMWIMMLILPTPGASGFAEIIFSGYMKDLIKIEGFSPILAFVWRLITYYPYLLIGVIIAPKWILKNYKKTKK